MFLLERVLRRLTTCYKLSFTSRMSSLLCDWRFSSSGFHSDVVNIFVIGFTSRFGDRVFRPVVYCSILVCLKIIIFVFATIHGEVSRLLATIKSNKYTFNIFRSCFIWVSLFFILGWDNMFCVSFKRLCKVKPSWQSITKLGGWICT